MTWLRQLRYQASFDLMMFRRNPAATFFILLFPVIFLVLFSSLFGNEMVNGVRSATLYVPGILALAIISATFVNLAVTMTGRRERGILKRTRGTPLRPWVFITAQGVAAMLISAAMTVVVIGIGRVAFGVSVNTSGLLSLAITVVIGAAAFSTLGLAVTSILPSETAAPAITNAIVLPLYFISDVFIVDEKPAILLDIAKVFPVQHLAKALAESFDPFATGIPWPWQHWVVIAGWGLLGLAFTLMSFRWTPRN